MAIMYGIGKFGLFTSGLSTNKLIPMEPVEFSIDAEIETLTASKYVSGKRQTAGSVVASEAYTMTVGIEAVNWMTLQLAYSELSKVTTSKTVSDIKYATVPSSSPYVISDAAITTSTAFALSQSGSWGPAKPLSTEVTLASGSATFTSTYAGASVAYRTSKSLSSVDTIGVESVAETLSSFTFSGMLYSDEDLIRIEIPRLSISGVPSLSISDVTNLSIEFALVSQGGARRPFELVRVTSE